MPANVPDIAGARHRLGGRLGDLFFGIFGGLGVVGARQQYGQFVVAEAQTAKIYFGVPQFGQLSLEEFSS